MRRHTGRQLDSWLGGTGGRHGPPEPKPGSDIPESSADAPPAPRTADDAVSGAGSDTTSAAVAAAQSSALKKRRSVQGAMLQVIREGRARI